MEVDSSIRRASTRSRSPSSIANCDTRVDHRELFELSINDSLRCAIRRPRCGHSTREHARAWADGDVITLVRTDDAGDAVALFNVGANDATGLPAAREAMAELARR